MAEIEIFRLSGRILREKVMEARLVLATLRVVGSQIVWGMESRLVDMDSEYTVLFRGVKDPVLALDSSAHIATLATLYADASAKALLYDPAMSASIEPTRHLGVGYVFNASHHELTRQLIANMNTNRVRIKVDE